ncbi:uncharacterized protein LOC144714115 [Wolffia australiana]
MAQQPQEEQGSVTEMEVRMDCRRCAQKVKKALQRVAGVSDVAIDMAQSKVTVTATAPLDDILKALKKTRKSASVVSHTRLSPPPQPSDANPTPPEKDKTPPPPPPPPQEKEAAPSEEKEKPPAPEEGKKAPPSEDNPTAEKKEITPPAEEEKKAEPSDDKPTAEKKEITPPEEDKPTAEKKEMAPAAEEKKAEPSDYPYHHQAYHLRPENVVLSYNRHRPVGGVAEYVYLKPEEQVIAYVESSYEGVVYHPYQNNAASVFSDENPNSCSVM